MTNNSRSKVNHAIKFGQLTENNVRNIFHENSYTKYGGEIFTDPFLKTLFFSKKFLFFGTPPNHFFWIYSLVFLVIWWYTSINWREGLISQVCHQILGKDLSALKLDVSRFVSKEIINRSLWNWILHCFNMLHRVLTRILLGQGRFLGTVLRWTFHPQHVKGRSRRVKFLRFLMLDTPKIAFQPFNAWW